MVVVCCSIKGESKNDRWITLCWILLAEFCKIAAWAFLFVRGGSDWGCLLGKSPILNEEVINSVITSALTQQVNYFNSCFVCEW